MVPQQVYVIVMGAMVLVAIVGGLATAKRKLVGLYASLALSVVVLFWVWVGVVVEGQAWVASLTGTVTQIVQGITFLLYSLFVQLAMMEYHHKNGSGRVCRDAMLSGLILGLGAGFILFFLVIPASTGWAYGVIARSSV